jgi:hypothetical protein
MEMDALIIDVAGRVGSCTYGTDCGDDILQRTG